MPCIRTCKSLCQCVNRLPCELESFKILLPLPPATSAKSWGAPPPYDLGFKVSPAYEGVRVYAIAAMRPQQQLLEARVRFPVPKGPPFPGPRRGPLWPPLGGHAEPRYFRKHLSHHVVEDSTGLHCGISFPGSCLTACFLRPRSNFQTQGLIDVQ